jgi:hypothetical protein
MDQVIAVRLRLVERGGLDEQPLADQEEDADVGLIHTDIG